MKGLRKSNIFRQDQEWIARLLFSAVIILAIILGICMYIEEGNYMQPATKWVLGNCSNDDDQFIGCKLLKVPY